MGLKEGLSVLHCCTRTYVLPTLTTAFAVLEYTQANAETNTRVAGLDALPPWNGIGAVVLMHVRVLHYVLSLP